MYKDFIKSVLSNSSKVAIDNFGNQLSIVKSGDSNQVLTETDNKIGSLLIDNIEENFPDHTIIDEEKGVIDNKSDLTWVIDPIDGTSNFAKGLPHYGTMIGLLKEGQPIAAGIVLPYFKETYIAIKNEGCYLNGIRIFVSKETKLINSLVVYQIDGHQENPDLTKNECKLLAQIVLNIRNLRTSSSVFDLVMVAQGKYGAILNKTSKIWDNVAQQLIIEEAGGIYTDFSGRKMDYSNPIQKATQNFTYCAGNPILHKELIDIISQYGQ